jgi:hypothetical protein
VSGNKVYVGGLFLHVDDISASCIASWDMNTHTWSAMGSPMTMHDILPWAHAVAIAANGDVYVGGIFDTIGGISAKNIARWDGNTWHALNAGVYNDPSDSTSYVSAISVNASDVYIGGLFVYPSGLAVNNVARWDGSAWNSLGYGTSGTFPQVMAIVVRGTNVFVGGEFLQVSDSNGSYTVGHIAEWNGYG